MHLNGQICTFLWAVLLPLNRCLSFKKKFLPASPSLCLCSEGATDKMTAFLVMVQSTQTVRRGREEILIVASKYEPTWENWNFSLRTTKLTYLQHKRVHPCPSQDSFLLLNQQALFFRLTVATVMASCQSADYWLIGPRLKSSSVKVGNGSDQSVLARTQL